MHCLSFFAVLALVLGSTQTMASGDEAGAAECNSIGCVRPTNAVEDLAKTTVHTLSAIRVIEPGNAPALCGIGHYATEPVATPLPKKCGNAGCATPELEG